MKRIAVSVVFVGLLLVLAVGSEGCSSLSALGALTDIQHLQFKLGDVNNYRVDNIDISRLSEPSQIPPLDLARLGTSIARKSLPVSFRLNVLAKNPNDGAGRTQPTPLYLNRMEWTLVINDRTTITGVVNKELEIPGNGQTTTIPLDIQLDLFKFFNDKGLNDLLDLAFAMGGAKGSSANLQLLAKVAVRISGVGVIEYPNQLTIVNHSFTNG